MINWTSILVQYSPAQFFNLTFRPAGQMVGYLKSVTAVSAPFLIQSKSDYIIQIIKKDLVTNIIHTNKACGVAALLLYVILFV